MVPRLKARGVRSIMMTGDAEGVCEIGGKRTGLDEYFAQVLPDQKATRSRNCAPAASRSRWSATG